MIYFLYLPSLLVNYGLARWLYLVERRKGEAHYMPWVMMCAIGFVPIAGTLVEIVLLVVFSEIQVPANFWARLFLVDVEDGDD